MKAEVTFVVEHVLAAEKYANLYFEDNAQSQAKAYPNKIAAQDEIKKAIDGLTKLKKDLRVTYRERLKNKPAKSTPAPEAEAPAAAEPAE